MTMQSFESISSLWQEDLGNDLPDANKMKMQILETRRQMMRKYIIGATILVLTFLFIGCIGWYYHFEQWTTRIGIIIVLLAIVMGVAFNTKLIQLLMRQGDLTLDNRKYLEQLIHFRDIQNVIENRGVVFYFILLSLGLALYMVEFAQRNIYFGIAAYTISFGWIVFAWLYIRKKRVNKNKKEINQQIERLNSLLQKMDEE